ncbi:MAG: hypothetical protein AB7V45_02735 [Candidatus Krumholzibacteriia bacterium]
MNPRKLLSSWLLITALCLAGFPAGAESPPPLSRIVAAVEQAETAELARLDAAIAASVDRVEILDLQRCAAYVKLAGRLAICEGRLGRAGDEGEKERLAGTAARLRADLDRQEFDLPAGYRYDPLALLKQEVQPCAE